MSRRERVVAALLLTLAVAGGALIPRLLASPPASLGIGFGPGPSRSVVQAPTIPGTRRHAAPQPTTSQPSHVIAAPVAPVIPATVRPLPAPKVTPPRHVPAPTPAPPPAKTTVPTPVPVAPPPSQPVVVSPAAVPAAPPGHGGTPPGHGGTPPGQAKKSPGHGGTPPGQTRTPPGQAKVAPQAAKIPPGHAKTPPGQAKKGRDLPGSGHGEESSQAPPQPVGHHHRHVGHLASPPSRPAPPAPRPRPQARPETRGPHGKVGHGPPPAQVAHGHHGHGKGDD